MRQEILFLKKIFKLICQFFFLPFSVSSGKVLEITPVATFGPSSPITLFAASKPPPSAGTAGTAAVDVSGLIRNDKHLINFIKLTVSEVVGSVDKVSKLFNL